jgi:uncharacterized sporulation protein YeaH/YhbH (DUF444 family)
MTDVSNYCQLKKHSQELYKQLTAVRKEIKTVEEQMIQQCQLTQQPLVVVAENKPALIRLQTRTRRLPLTEEDLKLKLRECLVEKFGSTVDQKNIADFSVILAHRIWSERRVKTDPKISMKISKDTIM